MEVSFHEEIKLLQLGKGEEFHGEGILAITKALLQSGVSYIGGYQGAPVSHLLDVMVQAKEYLSTLGVHVEACSNEASAAAMLGASIHYPMRGAVTWKSIVGTNVAADALSNLSSAGVVGGVLIVVGEDYGEGASVIQERTHAYAMKSSMILVDPRPNLAQMVNMVEHAFALSECSNMPAMMELRIRACHVKGMFEAKNNIAPTISSNHLLNEPASFNYEKLAHPPVTFIHEKLKYQSRIPAAQKYITEHNLNELFDGELHNFGIIVQGGLYNTLIRVLNQFDLADVYGNTKIPIYVLNVVYPLVPNQIEKFCSNKDAVIIIEEGQPEYIEQEICLALRRLNINTPIHGKDIFQNAGEYNADVMIRGLITFVNKYLVNECHDALVGASQLIKNFDDRKKLIASKLIEDSVALPPRPPGFCIGCPERPVFSAIKLSQRTVGDIHISADIGCHSFGTFPPFSTGHTILGYGMSLASRAGVSPNMQRRVLSIMGDGGFWHNGLLTGVQSALFNGDDAVLLIFKNGYTSATGTQDILSTPSIFEKNDATDKLQSLVHTNQSIENTLQGLGVQWLKSVNTYEVDRVRKTLIEAFTSSYNGLKVIIAEGECQLERQRRIKPWLTSMLKAGKRVMKVKYGVDAVDFDADFDCFVNWTCLFALLLALFGLAFVRIDDCYSKLVFVLYHTIY